MKRALRVPLAVGIISVLAVAVTLSAQSQTSWRVSWLNVTLGEPLSAVHNRLGDWLVNQDVGSGLRAARYLAGDPPGFLSIIYENGNVAEISLQATPWSSDLSVADPFGVKVGMSEDDVKRLRGQPDATNNGSRHDRLLYGHNERWQYVTSEGKVTLIMLSAPPEQVRRLPQSAIPAAHRGRSVADAIVVKATSEENGVRFEYAYLALNACPIPKETRNLNQALLQRDGRRFDVMTVACGASSEKKTYYFDISSSFGRR